MSEIRLSKTLLNFVVFICGGCVMVLELVGSRLMAPYLGTSIFVWTSLIGVILGCLSLGYWLGGLLADRKPEIRIFSRILMFSGISVSFTALSGDPLLMFMQSMNIDIRINSALATLFLFGVPGILLGMVAPYAVRLKLVRLDQTGSTAGGLYALSTLGSIAGTFLAGFVLLSYFSHRSILFFLSSTLVLLSILLTGKNTRIIQIVVLTIVLLASGIRPLLNDVMGREFHDEHTAYNRVWIYDGFINEQPIRVMQINETLDSIIYTDKNGLVMNYAHFFRLAGHFNPDITSSLLIGGGAYSYLQHFLAEHTNATMDAVEIDPGLTELSRKYFNLHDQPRMRIYHEDGRTFLNKSQNKYDVIFGDAYKSFSVPFQLATVEAMQKVHASLNKNGIFMANVLSGIEGENGKFLRAFLATLETVFPQVLVFAVQDMENGEAIQNIVTVAFKNDDSIQYSSPFSEINDYLSHRWTKPIPRDMPVLTDAWAPVEHYVKSMIVNKPELRNSFMQKKLEEYFEN
jgi:spermidine synthase